MHSELQVMRNVFLLALLPFTALLLYRGPLPPPHLLPPLQGLRGAAAPRDRDGDAVPVGGGHRALLRRPPARKNECGVPAAGLHRPEQCFSTCGSRNREVREPFCRLQYVVCA